MTVRSEVRGKAHAHAVYVDSPHARSRLDGQPRLSVDGNVAPHRAKLERLHLVGSNGVELRVERGLELLKPRYRRASRRVVERVLLAVALQRAAHALPHVGHRVRKRAERHGRVAGEQVALNLRHAAMKAHALGRKTLVDDRHVITHAHALP